MSTRCPELPWGPESEAHVTEDARSLKEVSLGPSSWMEPPCWVSSPVAHTEDSWDQRWVLPGGPLISYGLQTALRGPDEPAGPT